MNDSGAGQLFKVIPWIEGIEEIPGHIRVTSSGKD
jgi:hypothetical protein